MHEIIEDEVKQRMGIRDVECNWIRSYPKAANIIKKRNRKNDDETDWTWDSWVTLSSQYNILFWIYSTVQCGVWKNLVKQLFFSSMYLYLKIKFS